MTQVLVVEDNSASLSLMVYLLKAFGYQPLTARDGLDGLEIARRERPDLILCDIQLPGADGLEVCRQLKGNPAFQDIPLVAVSAYAMVGDREKLLGAGFNGYLSKPIDPRTFIDQVAVYLPKTKVDISFSEATPPKPIRTVEGTIMVLDNSPINISLSRSMLEPFGYKIISAGSVDQAMGLLREQRPDAILSDLHMPSKDGFDFIQAVKVDPDLSEIPVLLITSTLWGDRERELALSLGAARFITRPIEPEALIEEIQTCRAKKKAA